MTAQTFARRPLKTRQRNWAVVSAQWLARAGVHPNTISLASVAAAALAALALWRHWFPVAALFIQARLLCNLLDGMVAVEGGKRSAAGEIYNDLPDRVSDALILVAAGYASGFPALGWLASMFAVLTAYVRVLGGACGLEQDFCGPMAKPQRMAVLTVASLLAPFEIRILAIALCVIAAGSLVTAAVRTRTMIRQLEGTR
jgi:phosphatidylglycerophosphate synthase